MISLLLPVHAGCAVISIALFIWRGLMMWIGRPLKSRFFRRTLPDSIDTVLLSCGVLMAFLIGISPLESDWMAAKIIGLVVYIILGAFALNYARKRWVKRACFIAAVTVYVYILAVAKTMSITPWM